MSFASQDPFAAFVAPCPPPDRIALVARVVSDASTFDADRRHVQECAGCQAELERLLLDGNAAAAEFVPSELLTAHALTRVLPERMRHAPSRARLLARGVRRFATMAAAAVLVLIVGLVWGISTGVAAAHAESASPSSEPFPLTVIRHIPIAKALTPAACAPAGAAASPALQQTIALVDLPAPTAKTTIALGAILGIKEAPDGRLLVNDFGRHQIRLFDKLLATSTVVIDSAPGSARSYGQGNPARPLIAYRGDSLLFRDDNMSQMLILDPFGTVSRALALTSIRDAVGMNDGRAGGVDEQGRLIYQGKFGIRLPGEPPIATMTQITVPFSASLRPRPGNGGGSGRAGGMPATGIPVFVNTQPDSIPILRVDLDARRADTVAKVVQPLDVNRLVGTELYGGGRLIALYDKDSTPIGIRQLINPLFAFDDWAVLSDGTIGIVRGHDYHVDWIHPDGTRSSSDKLPFDWKQLTDEDKQRLIDSTRADIDSMEAWATRREAGKPAPGDSIAAVDTLKAAPSPSGSLGRTIRCGSPGLALVTCPPARREWPYEIVPLSKIADYYPPIRKGSVTADADGNLWILPRVTSLSKNGALVYDVVNPKRGLVQRVRLPAGRSIAGFGKGGVVYLQAGTLKTGFTIERTVIPVAKSAKPTPQ